MKHQVYETGKALTLDFETTSTENYGCAVEPENRLLLACWRTHDGQFKHSFGSEYRQQALLRDIERHDFIIAHNAKFEIQWLKRCGVDPANIVVYDTMLAEYVLAGNRSWPLNLDEVGRKYTGQRKDPFVDKCMKAGICPSEIPSSLLLSRCIQDVETTYDVYVQQWGEVSHMGMGHLVYQRCALTNVLADVEFNGMFLDYDRVQQEYHEAVLIKQDLEEELADMAKGVNLNSPKQLGEFVYDTLEFKELKNRRGEPMRTPSGGRKTDNDTLSKLKATTPEQEKFIELRSAYGKVSSLLSKNLEFFAGVCSERDCTFTAQFNQSVTRTHRLSSSGVRRRFTCFPKPKSVQFQNLPRQCKSLFRARHKGWSIMEVDGSQLEFRVAAFLGHDPVAVRDITEGRDVHSFTAEVLTGAGQKTDRQGAKAHTFKPLYGGSSGTKAEKAYYSAFKERYSGIAAAQQRWIDTVIERKELETVSGLRFYWPNTTVQRDGFVTNTTSICNYPVQSLATAEIIPIALINMWHEMRGMESFIVNTIHDSVIVEVHPDEVEEVTDIAARSFTTIVYTILREEYSIDFNVPLEAGVKIGLHWGEGDERKYQAE